MFQHIFSLRGVTMPHSSFFAIDHANPIAPSIQSEDAAAAYKKSSEAGEVANRSVTINIPGNVDLLRCPRRLGDYLSEVVGEMEKARLNQHSDVSLASQISFGAIRNTIMAIEAANRFRQLHDGNQVLNEQISRLTSAGEEYHRSLKDLKVKHTVLEADCEKKAKEHALREAELESQIQALNDQLSHNEVEMARRCADLNSDIEHKDHELAKLTEENHSLRQNNEELSTQVASLTERVAILHRELASERRTVEEEFDKRRDLVLAESMRDVLREMSDRVVNISAELADTEEIVRLVRRDLDISSSSSDEDSE